MPQAMNFLICALCALSLSVNAAPLPSSSFGSFVSLNFGGSPQQDSTLDIGHSLLIKRDPIGFVSFNALGKPSPTLDAVVDIGPGIIGPNGFTLIDAQSTGFLTYFFQIVSPIKASIPIVIDAAGTIDGDSTANSGNNTFLLDARWAPSDAVTGVQLIAADALESFLHVGPLHREFGHSLNLNVETNHPYKVLMSVKAEATVRDLGAFAGAHAHLDPIFSLGQGIDPTQFSFEFSSGIGNSPVPLPAPLPLLGASLLALGFKKKRTRI